MPKISQAGVKQTSRRKSNKTTYIMCRLQINQSIEQSNAKSFERLINQSINRLNKAINRQKSRSMFRSVTSAGLPRRLSDHVHRRVAVGAGTCFWLEVLTVAVGFSGDVQAISAVGGELLLLIRIGAFGMDMAERGGSEFSVEVVARSIVALSHFGCNKEG